MKKYLFKKAGESHVFKEKSAVDIKISTRNLTMKNKI